MVRYETDGTATVLVDKFEGKRLNMPNDVVTDPQGRVWFTDPFYEGAAGPFSYDRANMELDHESVLPHRKSFLENLKNFFDPETDASES